MLSSSCKYNHLKNITCHLSPVTCHLSPVTCHLSPVTCYMSPMTCYLSPITCYMSPLTCYLSPVSCHLSPVTPHNCHLSTASCDLSSDYHILPVNSLLILINFPGNFHNAFKETLSLELKMIHLKELPLCRDASCCTMCCT